MSQGAVTEDVAVGKIGLKQRNLVYTQSTLFITLERSTEGLQARYDTLPWILRRLILGAAVWSNSQLDKNISFVTESQVADRGLSIPPSCTLRDLERATYFDKFGRRAFGQLQLH